MHGSETLKGLPTDNLYKFMAIFGLVLVVLSVVLPWRGLTLLADRAAAAEGLQWAAMAAELELTAVSAEVGRLKERTAAESDSAGQDQGAQLEGEWRELERRVIGLLRDDSMATLAQSVQQAEFAARMAVVSTAFGGILALAGVVIAGLGFRFWYVKLQRHLDAEVVGRTRVRATDSEPEVSWGDQNVGASKAVNDAEPSA